MLVALMTESLLRDLTSIFSYFPDKILPQKQVSGTVS